MNKQCTGAYINRRTPLGGGADIASQLDALAAAAGSESQSVGDGGDDGGRESSQDMVRRRRAAVAAAKALAMEDCAYASGVGLAVEAAEARAAVLRAAFTAQPSVKGRGYRAAGLHAYKVEW